MAHPITSMLYVCMIIFPSGGHYCSVKTVSSHILVYHHKRDCSTMYQCIPNSVGTLDISSLNIIVMHFVTGIGHGICIQLGFPP
uniref:Secreted protein n=1 Tax=Arundo donax TaxID=35708 RepID=A0A0A9EFT6_ARUDO